MVFRSILYNDLILKRIQMELLTTKLRSIKNFHERSKSIVILFNCRLEVSERINFILEK